MSATLGLSKWNAEYFAQRPDLDVLQKEVDDYMVSFDMQKAERKKDASQTRSSVDADGFVKVERGGRRNIVSDGRHTVSVAGFREIKQAGLDAAKSSASAIKSNFYRFQLRDQKKQQLQNLKARFEEDKQRIAAMKATRKFRPL